MSKESEDKFDELQAQAMKEQVVMLYFTAILPSGKAFNVTAKLLPEQLEEVGIIPSSGNVRMDIKAGTINKDAKDFLAKMEERGKKIAQLFTATLNPMMRVMTEAMIRGHHETK